MCNSAGLRCRRLPYTDSVRQISDNVAIRFTLGNDGGVCDLLQ
jgi:hypothetical protein